MNPNLFDSLEIAWRPAPDAFARSPLGRMAARHGVDDLASMTRRAVADPAWFWAAAAEDVGLRWMTPYQQVLDLSDGVAFPHFFKGGRLNWADCSVDRWVDTGRGESLAVWWEGDDGAHAELTYAELKERIDRLAGVFRACGVGLGDVVALLLPMVPEAIVTMLAAAKIGAITVPMFSGYGPEPIRERLAQSGAKLLVTCDAFPRRGRPIQLKAIADEAAAGVATLERILVVGRLGIDVPMRSGRDMWWADAMASAEPIRDALPLDVETPCLLLYSSGSTGRPKGCVHTHGGLPFKFAQEARHGLGVEEGTRLLWLTDMGWVMGAYLITASLTNGGVAVLYEGMPDHPTPDRLWAVAERSEANILGVAPTAVRSLMAKGDEWPDRHPLEALTAIATTGEPWNIEPWRWCFDHVAKRRVPIVNISGGTECGASIVSGTIYSPVKPAAFPGPTLGMAADVFDDTGRPVRGSVGELVVRAPWPGMTKGFWQGDDRYFDTYWSRFPGSWQQGDFAYVDADGFWFLLGRSDDTIKLGGKRVGPAEIESVLVDDPDVIEAAAVGIPDDVKGEVLACFVVLQPEADPVAVCQHITDAVVVAHGKAMKPYIVHAVAGLPKTRNGKIMRRVVKAHYLREALGDLTALDNPEVLDSFPTVVR